MMQSRLFRILIILAGVMGADGVILAAASAHQDDAARLVPASSMLLFHAAAVLAVVALAERGRHSCKDRACRRVRLCRRGGLVRRRSDLAALCRPQPVSDGRAHRRHASDRELAHARGSRRLAADGLGSEDFLLPSPLGEEGKKTSGTLRPARQSDRNRPTLKHDPEKQEPVFRKDHAQSRAREIAHDRRATYQSARSGPHPVRGAASHAGV